MKENTRGLTHMIRKQMWKITEEKGLVDQALELEKGVKQKPGSGRIARKSVEVGDVSIIFQTRKLWKSMKKIARIMMQSSMFFQKRVQSWSSKTTSIR